MKGSTPAIEALRRAGIAHTVLPYDHVPGTGSYGLEAARALDRDPEQVFKTLIVRVENQPRNLAVGIVPVTTRLNLKQMARAAGVKKVTMAPSAAAERATGYVVGGISPLGQLRALPTVIDDSARAWGTILVSAGRRGLDIELTPGDLAVATGAIFAALRD